MPKSLIISQAKSKYSFLCFFLFIRWPPRNHIIVVYKNKNFKYNNKKWILNNKYIDFKYDFAYNNHERSWDGLYTEIVKIIEGGLLGDKEKVQNYAVVLANNLEKEGEVALSNR